MGNFLQQTIPVADWVESFTRLANRNFEWALFRIAVFWSVRDGWND